MENTSMSADKKSLAIAAGCYALWGILPAYWQLMEGVDSLLVLCLRIIFSLAFTLILLGITRQTKLLLSTLRDKSLMRWLAPAALLVTFNWGLYIWGVNSGRVIECSLGYYMNPLIVFLLGVLLFREKCTRLQLFSVALAFAGVLISVIAYGDFPFISFGLALSFAAYGVLKKKAHVEPISGIAVETLIMTPFALAFAAFFRADGIAGLNTVEALLAAWSGAVTATPLILYGRSVNHIPFFIVGFIQYISPSISLVYAILVGETASTAQIISFSFIWLGLAVFSFTLAGNKQAPS